jgi:hypothetical protein
MLEVGQKKIFMENLESYPIQYPQYTTAETSTKYQETYDSVGNLQAASEKIEGGSISYGKVGQAYQTIIVNKTWANGYSHTYEAVKDDQYGCVNSVKAKELAHTMRDLEEETAVAWLDNAFTTALADGKALCDDDHPCHDAPGQVNDTLTTGALSPANLKTAIQMFNRFKNHAGKPMKSYPNRLITNMVNQFTVQEILKSQLQANELSNTKNVLPPMQEVYLRYLTSETAWFLEDTRFIHIIFQWREKTFFGQDYDVRDTLDYYFNAVSRNNCGAIPNIGIAGSAG